MRDRTFRATIISRFCEAFTGAASAQSPDPIPTEISGVCGKEQGSMAVLYAEPGGAILGLGVTGSTPGTLRGFDFHGSAERDKSRGSRGAGSRFSPDTRGRASPVETGFRIGDRIACDAILEAAR